MRFKEKGSTKRKRVKIKRDCLMVVDGHSQLYRAMYAPMPELMANGVPTKVLYGFLRMLFSVIKDLKPTHLVCCFDGSKKDLLRTKWYPAYKGNRPKDRDNEEEMKSFFLQVGMVKQCLKALKIKKVTGKKYEADDLVASITNMALEFTDLDVVIITRDKDLEQLITDRVIIYDPQDSVRRTVQSVTKKRGFPPELVGDFLAIAGDSSDNIPGVKGIGEVFATKALQEYGSLEMIYANLDQLTKSKREKFEAARETIGLMKKLVTLVGDIEMPFTVEDLAFVKPDYEAASPLFKKYGFRTLSHEK